MTVTEYDWGRSPRGGGSVSVMKPCGFFWVDLRAGGGATPMFQAVSTGKGRSPRGRRNRRALERFRFVEGSISARAEEPASVAPYPGTSGVDLRAGGGALGQRMVALVVEGRSPRGRRSHRIAANQVAGFGVDLRAGGGACAVVPMSTLRARRRGRSPRGRRSPQGQALSWP